MISTGSTLLDLAITGTRVRGGGIPVGIFVEIFGPNQSGKTVLLSEIAGSIQRLDGEIQFHDPEARLSAQFALIFDLDISDVEYGQPDTVTEVFEAVRKWKPKAPHLINGIFADSLAALSTDMEMGKDEGDKMGMRRPKEFSEQMRRTCRDIVKKNYLMVCSNQIRENIGAGEFGLKVKSPGGKAMEHYPSLRLRTHNPKKIWKDVTYNKKDIREVVGVETVFEVFKSSVDKPYRKAPVTIIFDYGIDNIRENLQYVKTYTSNKMYFVGDRKLNVSMEVSIRMVEKYELEDQLREQVIDIWEIIASKFDSNRKKKKR